MSFGGPLSSYFIVLLMLTWSLVAPAASFENCRDSFINDTLKQTENLESRYQQEIQENNRPFVLKAKNRSQKLVILLHGYMGSPDEMRNLALGLQAHGYNVYAALIPGYGADADTANRYKHQQWTSWTTREVNRASRCFSEIHMAGFSTGGLLIHDYLLKHSDENLVKSISLISPFFKPEGLFSTLILDSVSIVLNKIPVNLVYFGLDFPDVQIMTLRKESYLQEVPVQSADEIATLAKINSEKTPSASKIETPALVFVTEDDRVADPAQTKKISARNFVNLTTIIYDKNRKRRIPHHLLAREVSPVAKAVEEKIIEHIEQSWH